MALVSHCWLVGFIVFSSRIHSTIAPLKGSVVEELLHVLESCLFVGQLYLCAWIKPRGRVLQITGARIVLPNK